MAYNAGIKGFQDKDYEVAMTATLVVENMKGPFRSDELLR